jgi:hypothetical protein
MIDTNVETPILELTELLEAQTVAGETGRHVAEVTLIRSGTSKQGNHYSPAVLRESAPLFEGAIAFADHQKPGDLPERSVRDIVGYYRNVRELTESGASRLRAELHLVPGTDWLYSLLQESQNHPSLCGLSIDAFGETERGSDGTNLVKSLKKVLSVDVVTRPSAGGSFDRLIQSERKTPVVVADPTQPSEQDKIIAQLQEQARTQGDELAALRKIHEEEGAARVKLAESRAHLTTKLTEAALPEIVDRKLRKRFDGRVFELVELEEAIVDEKDMLAALSESGQVTGMGAPKVELGLSEFEQVQAAFDGLFEVQEADSKVPRLGGIREAFAIATGVDIAAVGGADRPLKESLRSQLEAYVRAGRLKESETHLQEADVTTASFSYLLGTSMNKRLLKDYQAWPSEWQKFTTINAIKDFKQQDRIRLGAFGSLSTVAEDAAYTTLTLSDTRAIYTPTKRGNLVQVTRETIINDDLYAIKQIPQKLAVAAAFTLAEFVYNLLAPNFGNIYDAHPLFDSINHLNTGVLAANLGVTNSGTALSSAALQAAIIKMRKQTNMASKPIGLKPRYLLTVPDLEFTAMTLLKSAGLPGGNNNDINPMLGYAEPIISPQLNALAAGPASVAIWIAIADPRVVDTLEVGFVGGQANPVLLIQDMPLYGLNFTQDTISYKVRHEYGGAVVDYRGFYLGNN